MMFSSAVETVNHQGCDKGFPGYTSDKEILLIHLQKDNSVGYRKTWAVIHVLLGWMMVASKREQG